MRRWLTWIAVVAVLVLAVELVVLGVAVAWLGVAWTLALTVLKWVCGGLLVQREGGRGWRRFQEALNTGQPPGREVTGAAVGLGAALLVLVAGFVSAVAGVVLLVPPVRRAVAALVERVVTPRLSAAAVGDVFGPRRVRVRRGDPAEGKTAPARPDAGVLEGEILPRTD
jgi:UPF0716 protein FxsA